MVEYFSSQLLQFLDDLVTIIGGAAQWGTDFGVKPAITKKYNKTVTGLATSKVEEILIYVEKEFIKPFSLGVGVNPTKSWYHTLPATIEIRTNVSDIRLDQLVYAVTHTLKSNVTYSGYVQILLKSVTPLSSESRNSFGVIIDVEGQKYAPIKTV